MNTVYYVTGAAGFLGSRVVDELLRKGGTVRALVLPGDPLAARLPAEVQQVKGDILNPQQLDAFLEAGEQRDRVVIHCAAIISMSMQPVQKVHNINVNGTSNVVEACLKWKVRKLVYVSSVHALPEKPKGQTIHETTEFEPEKLVGAYAQSKGTAAKLVMEAHRERGLPVTILFPSGLTGPGALAGGNLNQTFIDYMKGDLIAGVEGGYSFSDVRDVAPAVVAAIEHGENGEGYILASHYVTIREIFDSLHKLTGGREIKVMIPLWLVRLLTPLIALYYKLRGQPSVFSAYAIYTLSSNGDFNNEKARKALGFDPRPFEDTLRDTIAWLRKEHNL